MQAEQNPSQQSSPTNRPSPEPPDSRTKQEQEINDVSLLDTLLFDHAVKLSDN